MAVDVKAFLNDKKVWAAAAAGGGLGLLVYLRRKQQPAGGATGEGATSPGQIIQPAVADSSSIDAYNNLQNEIENLAGQVTALYGGGLPTAQQAVSPAASPSNIAGRDIATISTARRISPGAYSYSGPYANVLSQITAAYKSPGVETLKAPAGYTFKTNSQGQTFLVYTGK